MAHLGGDGGGDLGLVHGELDGLGGRLGAQVVHAGLQAQLPPLKKAKTNHISKKESQSRHPPLPTSHLAQRLTQPKRPAFMPPLPTEPEPPETVRGGKEDQIDLWGAPVVGEQDNNSGDGGDYGSFTESDMHADDDVTPVIDQVI